MADIDIVVVTYNAKEKLERCIRSIRKHTRNIPYTLTVVDNHCTDGTSDFLKTLGRDVSVISNKKNLGCAGGKNAGLKSTSGKYIALVDDDAEMTKNWLKKLYKKINENINIGIVGCKVVFPNRMIFCAEIDVRTGSCLPVGHGEIDEKQRNYVKPVDGVCGACWLMRREVVEQVGFFDKQFNPLKCEDIDYCLMTKQAGFEVVYDGNVPIIHHSLNRDDKIETAIENSGKFMKKWQGLKDFTDPKGHMDHHIGGKSLKGRPFISMALESARKRKYEKAIKYLRCAIGLEPYNHVAFYHLARIYKKMGQLDKAKMEAEKSLNIFGYIIHCPNIEETGASG